MRQYVVNLTGYLIGKNKYGDLFGEMGDSGAFVQHVKLDLYSGDVRAMNPETLGRIMCSLEIGDVMAQKKDLFDGVSFCGDCGDLLRELVSLCLAYAIRERFNPHLMTGVPPWEGRKAS